MSVRSVAFCLKSFYRTPPYCLGWFLFIFRFLAHQLVQRPVRGPGETIRSVQTIRCQPQLRHMIVQGCRWSLRAG